MQPGESAQLIAHPAGLTAAHNVHPNLLVATVPQQALGHVISVKHQFMQSSKNKKPGGFFIKGQLGTHGALEGHVQKSKASVSQNISPAIAATQRGASSVLTHADTTLGSTLLQRRLFTRPNASHRTFGGGVHVLCRRRRPLGVGKASITVPFNKERAIEGPLGLSSPK